MIVLGIESTCDETGCAIVRNGKDILSNVVSSQIDLHKAYGGVVPELACRRHIDVIIPVIRQALEEAQLSLEEIDLIAVAHGPGLIGALLIGVNTAKGLSLSTGIPLVGVNHVEAHLYAALMDLETPPFPCLGVVISGGHTHLVKMHDLGQYSLLGQTIDDAIGEAFDKVAKVMGLPYPGGPAIESLAKEGEKERYTFRPGRVKGSPLDFSFSGLKTQVLYTVKGANARKDSPLVISPSDQAHVAAAFQHTAMSDVVTKSLKAYELHACQAIALGGGVANNRYLRQLFEEKAPHIPVHWPAPALTLDNAAMIAGLGYHTFLKKGADSMDLEVKTRISLAS